MIVKSTAYSNGVDILLRKYYLYEVKKYKCNKKENYYFHYYPVQTC